MPKTLANIVYLFIAVLLAKVLGTITSFFVAKLLSPANYGVWTSLMLIISYTPIIALGTVEALIKEYPYYIGMGKEDCAKTVEEGVFSFLVISSLLLLVVGITFHLFANNVYTGSLAPLIQMMILASVVSMLSPYYYYRFTAHQQFRIVSLIDLFKSISTFIFLVLFTWLWGLKGTVAGFFVSGLTVLLFSATFNNKILGKIAFNFDLKLIWKLIRIGFPITIIWWVFILQTSVDRVISISLLGKTATGYYGLGVNIVATLILVPMVVGRVLYPKINEKIGKGHDQYEMQALVIMPSHAISLLLAAVIGIFLITSPTIYHYIFPKYSPGLASAQILLLGAYFVSLIRNGVNYLVANNEQNQALKYVIISFCVNIALSLLLVKLGYGIEGLASSTAISGALLTTAVWKSTLKNMGYGKYDQLKELFYLYSPFILLLVLLGSIKLAVPSLLLEDANQVVYCNIIFIILYGVAVFTTPPFNDWVKQFYSKVKAR